MRREWTYQWLVAGLVWAMAGSVSAQMVEDYRYKGTVKDTSGAVVAGVKITLRDAKSGKRISFETNKKGEFDRRNIPHAVYTITIEKDGYVPLEQQYDWSAWGEKAIVKEADIVLESTATKSQREQDQAKAELGKKSAHLYEEAYAALGKEDCDTAHTKATELLSLGAGSLEYATRFVVARCLRIKGSVDASIVEYRKVIELKPDLFEAHFDLANTLAGSGDTDGALAAYRQAVTLRPEDGVTQYEAGALLFNAGKRDEARPFLEAAIELKPDHAQAQMALGYVHLQSEQPDFPAAKRCFGRFLELAPDSPMAEQVKAIVAGIK